MIGGAILRAVPMNVPVRRREPLIAQSNGIVNNIKVRRDTVSWTRLDFNPRGRDRMAKSKRGLDGRHRDKTGRIERKHGNTKVAALRKEYGEHFAHGRRKDMMLKTLLKETGSASLHDYLKHHHK
jgi:hypothetical protein